MVVPRGLFGRDVRRAFLLFR
jgi:uncharacterized membrane protein YeaQ/YmgE (transglycosylase-associated protein family)